MKYKKDQSFSNLVKLLNKDVKFDQVKPAFSKTMGTTSHKPPILSTSAAKYQIKH